MHQFDILMTPVCIYHWYCKVSSFDIDRILVRNYWYFKVSSFDIGKILVRIHWYFKVLSFDIGKMP